MKALVAFAERKQSSTTLLTGAMWHGSVHPLTDHELLDLKKAPHWARTPMVGHDFDQMSTQVTEHTVACGVSPRLCPTGGVCHICPRRVHAKRAEDQLGDENEHEATGEIERMMRTLPAQMKRYAISRIEPTFVPPLVQEALHSPSQPLDTATRAFMEPCFGHDFSSVRVHTDARAAQSARAVNALAYTVGSDVMFDVGCYRPNTNAGRKLIAHELMHVVQHHTASTTASMGQRGDPYERAADLVAGQFTLTQTQAKSTPLIYSVPSGPAPVLQREERETSRQVEGEDPGFLLCLALCELGIPPAVWRTITRLFLEAVWEEYRQQYTEAQAIFEFRTFRTAFRLYSPLRVAKLILTFIVQSKIGLIPVRAAAAQAIRTRLETMLLARGATTVGIQAAEQIVRRVAVMIEIAIAAGCLAYCGGTAYARALIEMTDAFVVGVADTMNVLGVIGEAGRQIVTWIIVRPMLVARSSVDPTNWDLSALPARTRADLGVLGAYLWARLQPDNPDQFATNVTRPLRSYTIPPALISDIVGAMSQTASARTGFTIEFTPDLMLGLTPLTFIQLLHDWRLLRFRRDPEQVADAALSVAQQIK